jgi:hypothetical protein
MKLNAPQTSGALMLCGLAFTTSGCEVIGGIFKAGVWVGVAIVVVVVGLIAWAIKAAAG